MKVVIVGYGSIGKRHVKNLISIGVKDIILCRSSLNGNELNLKEVTELADIIKINPDFVIVSNPTSLHFQTLKFLVQYQFNILCEKPFLHRPEEWDLLKPFLKNYKGNANIVFNLRFHPCVQKVKELIFEGTLGKIHSARFFVGQYLPDWRPETNHLDSYSASKRMGGGVVMDLVHEIDVAEYLLGKPHGEIHSIVSKVSDVTVDSADIAEILYSTINREIVNIHMDYLYRGYSRHFSICGKEANLHCDLSKNIIKITGDKNKKIEYFEFKDFERNDMYLDLISDYIKGLTNTSFQSSLPSFHENESVMHTCFQINNY
jgi:predicted dehydrogenase